MNQGAATTADTLPADPQGTPAPQPSGIKGWLLIPAFFTLAAPLGGAGTAYTSLLVLIAGEELSTGLKIFIAVEIIVLVVLIPAWAYAAYLLLKRKRQYPAVFITLFIFGALYFAVDSAIAVFGFDMTPDKEMVRGLIRTISAVIVWVPYMMRSKRVRNTFVR